jgi:tetraacyldisaccharide 4'-kinase
LYLAGMLRDEGLPVAILSRGYRGAYRGPALIVSDGTSVLADAVMAGDEPVMLARALPGVVVAVGARRDVVGRAVETRFGPRVHLLDDGFQHLRLARDLDLLCVDAADLGDRPLPAGRLRERPSAAARADLVLLTGDDDGAGAALGDARTFHLRRRIEGFADGSGQPHPAPRRPFAFCGLARPERFEADLRAQGVDLAGARRYRDHHPYSAADGETLLREARAAAADALVTTAKDAVRLPANVTAARDLPLLVLRMTIEIGDAAGLRGRVLAVARRAA